MGRKLKTFITSIGFFDLAVAAPSMKAALEAWGVERNLFQQGTAWESDDAPIIAATMAQPGVVLRRAVGTDLPFEKDARLPKQLPTLTGPRPTLRKTVVKPAPRRREPPVADQRHKAAVIQFEKEKAKREKGRAAREEKRRAKDAQAEERRRQAVARAKTALDEARSRHQERLDELDRERAALDRKAETEKRRWERERETLLERIRDAG